MTDLLQSVNCLRTPFSKTARTSLSAIPDTFSLPSLMNLALWLVAYIQPGCVGLTVDRLIVPYIPPSCTPWRSMREYLWSTIRL